MGTPSASAMPGLLRGSLILLELDVVYCGIWLQVGLSRLHFEEVSFIFECCVLTIISP